MYRKKNRLTLLTQHICLLLAFYFIVLFIVIALNRLFVPFEVAWYEYDTLIAINRIRSLQSLYTAPTIDYTSFIYPPFFYYLATLWSFLFGTNFFTIRFVSLASTISTLLLILFIVQRETRNVKLGIVSTGIYASLYLIAGGFYDAGRVDALFTFLLLAFIFIFTQKNVLVFHIAAIIVLILAAFTKQTILITFPFIIVTAFLLGRNVGLLYLIVILFILPLLFYSTNLLTNNWLAYFVLLLPTKHSLVKSYLGDFWKYDIFFILPTSTILSLWYTIKKYFTGRVVLHILLLSMIILSYSGRLNIGGDENVLLPGYVAFSILTGLSLSQISRSWLLYFLVFIQFIITVYNPFYMIPTQQELRVFYNFLTSLKQQPGEIYLGSYEHAAYLAGKKTYANLHAANELVGAYGDRVPTDVGTNLANEFKKKIQAKQFKALYLDKADVRYMHILIPEFTNYYKPLPDKIISVKKLQYLRLYKFVPK